MAVIKDEKKEGKLSALFSKLKPKSKKTKETLLTEKERKDLPTEQVSIIEQLEGLLSGEKLNPEAYQGLLGNLSSAALPSEIILRILFVASTADKAEIFTALIPTTLAREEEFFGGFEFTLRARQLIANIITNIVAMELLRKDGDYAKFLILFRDRKSIVLSKLGFPVVWNLLNELKGITDSPLPPDQKLMAGPKPITPEVAQQLLRWVMSDLRVWLELTGAQLAIWYPTVAPLINDLAPLQQSLLSLTPQQRLQLIENLSANITSVSSSRILTELLIVDLASFLSQCTHAEVARYLHVAARVCSAEQVEPICSVLERLVMPPIEQQQFIADFKGQYRTSQQTQRPVSPRRVSAPSVLPSQSSSKPAEQKKEYVTFYKRRASNPIGPPDFKNLVTYLSGNPDYVASDFELVGVGYFLAELNESELRDTFELYSHAMISPKELENLKKLSVYQRCTLTTNILNIATPPTALMQQLLNFLLSENLPQFLPHLTEPQLLVFLKKAALRCSPVQAEAIKGALTEANAKIFTELYELHKESKVAADIKEVSSTYSTLLMTHSTGAPPALPPRRSPSPFPTTHTLPTDTSGRPRRFTPPVPPQLLNKVRRATPPISGEGTLFVTASSTREIKKTTIPFFESASTPSGKLTSMPGESPTASVAEATVTADSSRVSDDPPKKGL